MLRQGSALALLGCFRPRTAFRMKRGKAPASSSSGSPTQCWPPSESWVSCRGHTRARPDELDGDTEGWAVVDHEHGSKGGSEGPWSLDRAERALARPCPRRSPASHSVRARTRWRLTGEPYLPADFGHLLGNVLIGRAVRHKGKRQVSKHRDRVVGLRTYPLQSHRVARLL